MFGSILAAVLPSIVGGLFQSKENRDARRYAEENKGVDYEKLRRDAERAGFNPLTALMAGGGAGYQSNFEPKLASGSFISEAINRGVDTYFNQVSARDAEASRLREMAVEQQYALDRMAADPTRRFGYALTDQRPYRPQMSAAVPKIVPVGTAGNVAVKRQAAEAIANGNRPPVSPFGRDPEYIPVRAPNGNPMKILKDVADRLDVKPWGNLTAGDYTELAGDMVGEAITTYHAPAIVEYQTGRMFNAAPKILRDLNANKHREGKPSLFKKGSMSNDRAGNSF